METSSMCCLTDNKKIRALRINSLPRCFASIPVRLGAILFLAIVGYAPGVDATNGYFSHGFGTQSKAIAGGGGALPLDSLISATNPAGMAFIGNRIDVGAAVFNPNRSYTAEDRGPGSPIPPGTVESDGDFFAIPHFGWNHELGTRAAIGVSVYGNGGLNTDYDTNIFRNFALPPNTQLAPFVFQRGQPPSPTTPNDPNAQFVPVDPNGDPAVGPAGNPQPPFDTNADPDNPLNGNPDGTFSASTPTGVDLAQLLLGITYSYRLTPNQAIGVTPLIAFQQFEAEGLQPFKQFSVEPDKVTNNGQDEAFGFGGRFGWQGRFGPVRLGASYQTEVQMGEFDEYAGLFAKGGNFDIPANYTMSAAYQVLSRLTVTFDYQEILYGDIAAISNPNDIPLNNQTPDNQKLGGNDGVGFGWDDQSIFKVGILWDPIRPLTLLAGFSHADAVFDGDQSVFNILAPATIQQHVTAGAKYDIGSNAQVGLSVMRALDNSIGGSNPALLQGSPQEVAVEMDQWEVEVNWAWRY